MAKVKPPFEADKMPALTGRLIFYNRNGSVIAAKNPKKKGRNATEAEQANRDRFAEANLIAKYWEPETQRQAIRNAKGTPWYPRDFIVSATLGRLYEAISVDGKVKYSMALIDDITSDLDVISRGKKWCLLVRGNKYWEVIEPGSEGSVLTSNGTDALPSFQEAGGGGGGGFTWPQLRTAVSGLGGSTKGNPVAPLVSIKTSYALFALSWVSPGDYVASVFEIDIDGEITDILTQSNTFNPPSGGYSIQKIDFANEVTLLAGHRYMIALTRTDVSGSVGLPIYGTVTDSNYQNLPIDWQPVSGGSFHPRCWMLSNDPQPGDTFSIDQNGMWAIGFNWSF